MIDSNELRRLVQAATPGPWHATKSVETNSWAVWSDTTRLMELRPTKTVDMYQVSNTAAFIAAANPAAVSELLDRLEAAERAVTEAYQRGYATGQEEIEKERDALRAQVERMEKQEPAGQFIQHPSNGLWEQDGYGDNPDARPLYALPGAQAQPAPSVPTALLVAVADLVAQMEIVTRVGFVDAPDDKDSCAAFCVAEGTWLELMRCVESLAASLATAPEAKP